MSEVKAFWDSQAAKGMTAGTGQDCHIWTCVFCGKSFRDDKHMHRTYCSRQCVTQNRRLQPVSEETRRKIGQTHRGLKHSDTAKEKMRQKDFWNERAILGSNAGTRDRIAAELERRIILNYVKDGQNVLDIGCGIGELAIEMAKHHAVQVWAFDYSPKMIEQAILIKGQKILKGEVNFYCRDLTTDLASFAPIYDLVVSTRCLINLESWETQEKAICNILSLLKPGGVYVAMECSIEGLENTNVLRRMVGLEDIKPPFHNVYFSEEKLREFAMKLSAKGYDADLLCQHPLGTYTYLSRVINAAVAKEEGREPDYDSPINLLALRLPLLHFSLGQNILWTVEKANGDDN